MFSAISKRSQQKQEEVSLSQFAAICGLTESEFFEILFYTIDKDRFLDLIKEEARKDFINWTKKLSTSKKFCIMIRLSLNRARDAALYCMCSLKEKSAVKVKSSVPGLSGLVPKEAQKMSGFEFNFCDLNTNIALILKEIEHASESLRL